MGGHILMPEYMEEIQPGITPAQLMPATLCPEIMTGLLRDKLGFNGMVVTDASHMVGTTNRMKRKDMLPAAINAGCDMFLFFNDPDEDFATMLDAYNTGIISEERMVEALTRILGLKAAKGMHRKSVEELTATDEELAAVLNNEEFKAVPSAISKDAPTLVKYLDGDVLPLSPEKTKRVMIVHIKGAENPMMAMAMKAMGMGGAKQTPAEKLRDRLNAKGFEAFIYESPLQKMMREAKEGKPMNMNLYFAGKNAIADFTSGTDLVISLFDVGSKAACIAAMLKFGYDLDKVVMVGDAPGDCDAAEKNNVYYYPILVGHEKESWDEAIAVAFGKLQEGSYAEYGAEMKLKFLQNLGG